MNSYKHHIYSWVWVIMSKDRKLIATGYPRKRNLTPVAEAGKERLLTYKTKRTAEAAYRTSGFYGGGNITWREENLEAVEVSIVVAERSDITAPTQEKE